MDCLFLFEDNCYNKVGDRMGGGQPSDARGEEEEEGFNFSNDFSNVVTRWTFADAV